MALLAYLVCVSFFWKAVESQCPNSTPIFQLDSHKNFTITVFYPFQPGINKLEILLYQNDVIFSCNSWNIDGERVGDYIVNASSNLDSCSNESKQCFFELKVEKLGFYCAYLDLSECAQAYYTTTIEMKLLNAGPTEKPIQPESPGPLFWIILASCLILFVIITAIMYKFLRRNLCYTKRKQSCNTNIQLSEEHQRIYESLPKLVQIFVLYHNDNDQHFRMVQNLVSALEKLPNSEIFVDYNFRNEISQAGMSSWVSKMLERCDRTIIISSEGAWTQLRSRNHFKNSPNSFIGMETAFLFGWCKIVSDKSLVSNYTKLFNIRFEQTDPSFLLPDVVSGRHFEIPCHYKELVFQLLGCNKVDLKTVQI